MCEAFLFGNLELKIVDSLNLVNFWGKLMPDIVRAAIRLSDSDAPFTSADAADFEWGDMSLRTPEVDITTTDAWRIVERDSDNFLERYEVCEVDANGGVWICTQGSGAQKVMRFSRSSHTSPHTRGGGRNLFTSKMRQSGYYSNLKGSVMPSTLESFILAVRKARESVASVSGADIRNPG